MSRRECGVTPWRCCRFRRDVVGSTRLSPPRRQHAHTRPEVGHNFAKARRQHHEKDLRIAGFVGAGFRRAARSPTRSSTSVTGTVQVQTGTRPRARCAGDQVPRATPSSRAPPPRSSSSSTTARSPRSRELAHDGHHLPVQPARRAPATCCCRWSTAACARSPASSARTRRERVALSRRRRRRSASAARTSRSSPRGGNVVVSVTEGAISFTFGGQTIIDSGGPGDPSRSRTARSAGRDQPDPGAAAGHAAGPADPRPRWAACTGSRRRSTALPGTPRRADQPGTTPGPARARRRHLRARRPAGGGAAAARRARADDHAHSRAIPVRAGMAFSFRAPGARSRVTPTKRPLLARSCSCCSGFRSRSAATGSGPGRCSRSRRSRCSAAWLVLWAAGRRRRSPSRLRRRGRRSSLLAVWLALQALHVVPLPPAGSQSLSPEAARMQRSPMRSASRASTMTLSVDPARLARAFSEEPRLRRRSSSSCSRWSTPLARADARAGAGLRGASCSRSTPCSCTSRTSTRRVLRHASSATATRRAAPTRTATTSPATSR